VAIRGSDPVGFSNSCVRAAIVSLGILIASGLRYFQRYGDARDSRHISLVLLIHGTATVVTTLLVGTFSKRSAKPWPWLQVALVSFGCWLAVLWVLALTQKMYATR